MRIYSYLRASTEDQNAMRAKAALCKFVEDKGFTVSGWFIETISGAQLKRPELFKLLDIAEKGDVLLVEQIDRLSRLDNEDWKILKSLIQSKGIRIVALDLPTSHQLIKVDTDEFTESILDAINALLMDMLAATARKDYSDRRRRQAEGIKQNKHKFKGRGVNKDLHTGIRAHLSSGLSYSQIQAVLPCSRTTIAKVKKQMQAEKSS